MAENFIERDANVPIGIIASQFAEVADVTDMVAFAIVVTERPFDFVPRNLFDLVDTLQHTGGILSPTTDVVDFTRTRVSRKCFKRFDHVTAFDLVTYLFAFVTENRLRFLGHSDMHEVAQEPVQFHATMAGTRQTSTTKNSGVQSKVLAVFLSQHVCRGF